MPIPEPQPTPATDRPFVVNHGTPFWQVAALVIAMLGVSGVTAWWNRPATVQPAPAVVSQPVVVADDLSTLSDSRIFVTKNGKTLSDQEAKPIKDAVRQGDGIYAITGYPDGKAPVSKHVIISDNVKPIDPKPVDPQPDVKPVEPVITKPTAAFYVYEKDDTAVPDYIKTGLSKINAAGVEGTRLEKDTKDGKQQVPLRFQIPLAEAEKAGLPVLIVMSNGQFLRAVKPKSESEMLEAVK